jgi:transposase
MLTVDEFDRIRRMVLVEGTSQREAARRLGHSRKTIRKALKHSEPPGYRRSGEPVYRVLISRYRGIIDAWLEADKQAPRKQRHTRKQIWRRLCEEHDFQGGYDAVKRYVKKKQETSGEVYMPLSFDPGEEVQVDWGEAWIKMAGQLVKVFMFCMRLCFSRASYVRAYRTEKEEAFLDGHVRAFEFFGGVPRRCCYDNLKSAAIRVGRGQDRTLNDRFKALKSHYLFDVRFCNVARGNEKGHVENLVKHAQRRYMTPVPEVMGLEELNAHLEQMCRQDLELAGVRSDKSRGQLLAREQQSFLPLPQVAFSACRRRSTIADKQSLVDFDDIEYSVPVEYAHHRCTVSGYVDRIEIAVEDAIVAVHERSWSKGGYVLDWRHYVPLLERKPGAIKNGLPFKGQPWGRNFDILRQELEIRYGGEGTRKYVSVLLLFAEYSEQRVKAAVKLCVRRGAYSDEAVKSVLNYQPPKRIGSLDLSRRPELAGVGSGTRPVNTYDVLLSSREAGS